MEERTIYILLTCSETCFSRLIHLVTQAPYTHASIGLDGPRSPFYSFGRIYPRLLLPAGLVAERVDSRRQAIPCRLYRLRVSEEAYLRLRRRLGGMYACRRMYGYNILGVLACFLNLSLRRDRHYFCSQFVAELLQECAAMDLPKPPALLRPVDFCGMEGLVMVYQGPLKGILSQPAA